MSTSSPTARALRPLRRPLRPRDADARARRARGAPGAPRAPTRRSGRELDALLARLRRPPDAALLRRRGCPASVGGARVYLKREDLSHTGAHKINNCIGQALLARRMGKRRIIAETGAGQHGVATATVARAASASPCEVYMGAEDVERQALNVFRMQLLGATGARRSTSGTRTLKDAMNEALRDWVTNVARHALRASARSPGPHPYPTHGARPPGGDRPRGARADAGARAGACPTRWSPASAAARTRSACSTPSSPTPACSSSASRRRATASPRGRHAATLSARARRRAARLEVVRAQRRRRPDPAGALDLAPGSTIPASAPSTRGCKDTGRAQLRLASPTTRRSPRFELPGAHRGHPVRARDRARDRLRSPSSSPALRRGGRDRRRALGARRQGHADGGQGAGSGVVSEQERAKPPQTALTARMGALAASKEKALVVYLTAGDPSLAETPVAAGRDRARRRRRDRARRAVVAIRRPTAR